MEEAKELSNSASMTETGQLACRKVQLEIQHFQLNILFRTLVFSLLILYKRLYIKSTFTTFVNAFGPSVLANDSITYFVLLSSV